MGNMRTGNEIVNPCIILNWNLLTWSLWKTLSDLDGFCVIDVARSSMYVFRLIKTTNSKVFFWNKELKEDFIHNNFMFYLKFLKLLLWLITRQKGRFRTLPNIFDENYPLFFVKKFFKRLLAINYFCKKAPS